MRGVPERAARRPPGDLPNAGIEARLLYWQADSLPLSHQGRPDGDSFRCITFKIRITSLPTISATV